MAWTAIGFGRHGSKTLPQVLWHDPDWFFWAWEQGAFAGRPVQDEAAAIHARATRVRIPAQAGQNVVAEYDIHPSTKKFANVDVVPRDKPAHQGATQTYRLEYFDMSFPRQIAEYDKFGCRLLVRCLKYYLFGHSKYRMTKGRCEAFFDDPGNFL